MVIDLATIGSGVVAVVCVGLLILGVKAATNKDKKNTPQG